MTQNTKFLGELRISPELHAWIVAQAAKEHRKMTDWLRLRLTELKELSEPQEIAAVEPLRRGENET